MKKILLLLMMFSTSLLCLSQESWDVITLKNGSVIVGKITEFNFNENLTVQTKDGYGFMFRMQDIQSVKKEKKQEDEKFKMVMPNTQKTVENISQTSPQNPSNFIRQDQGQVVNYGNPGISSVPTYNAGSLPQQRQANTSTYRSPNNPGIQGNYQNTPNTNYRASNYQANPSGSYTNANTLRPANPSQFQNYQPTQTQNPQSFINQNNPNNRNYPQYQNPNYNNRSNALNNQQVVSGYYTNDPNNSRQQAFVSPSATAVAPARKVPSTDIFTNINNYSNLKNTAPKVDCNQGYGNFGFINKTNKSILVSLQKKQKDGYLADYKEIAIAPNSKGYFSNVKTNDYPFFVKTKNRLAGTNQSEYVILGRGSIRVEKCKTELLSIQ